MILADVLLEPEMGGGDQGLDLDRRPQSIGVAQDRPAIEAVGRDEERHRDQTEGQEDEERHAKARVAKFASSPDW